MAVALTNIVKSGFTQTNQIYYGASEISRVYWGSSLLWQKGGAFTPTWRNYTDGYMLMANYTPSSNVSVQSFKMKLTTNTSVYNYIVGIFTANGTKVISQTGTSNVSIVANGTIDSLTVYDHTITYPSPPSLTAGTSYFFVIGERYAAYKALTGESPNAGILGSAYGWSLTNATCNPAPIPTTPSVSLYLEVIPV
jgi:hypothetical protein